MKEKTIAINVGFRWVEIMEARAGLRKHPGATELSKGLVALDMLRNFIADPSKKNSIELAKHGKMLIEMEDII